MEERTERWRARARQALQSYFNKHSSPRSTLALLMVITGLAGLLCSAALLWLGLETMAIRYPVAALVSWCVLLGLIRLWAAMEMQRMDSRNPKLLEELDNATGVEPAILTELRTSWWDWVDVADLGSSMDEGCLPVVLVVAVLGLFVVVVVAIAGAPLLLAEVFLDVFIVSVLYRRLRRASREQWLGTAIRRTWLLAVITMLLLAVIGWGLEVLVPGADSIEDALREWMGW